MRSASHVVALLLLHSIHLASSESPVDLQRLLKQSSAQSRSQRLADEPPSRLDLLGEISAPIPQTLFGSSPGNIAVSGSMLAVSAELEGQGALYLYDCPPTAPPLSPCSLRERVISNGGADTNLGRSVALSPAGLLVATSFSNGAAGVNGTAHVFDCSVSPCVEGAALDAGVGASTDTFGQYVAVSGTTVFVSATGPASLNGSETHNYPGAVYPFDCSVPSRCARESALVAADGFAGDHLGWSIAASGEWLVAGAWGYDTDKGAAIVWRCQSAAQCTQFDKLIDTDGSAYAYFGASVAASGSSIAVTSYGWGGTYRGRVSLFECAVGAGKCSLLSHLLPASSQENDYFGFNVAMASSGIVSTTSFALNNPPRRGVFVFDCSAAVSTSGSTPCSEFGSFVGQENAFTLGPVSAVSATLLVMSSEGTSGAGAVFISGCAPGNAGAACAPCPSCGGHGRCEEGRAGSGLCVCDSGFAGAACDVSVALVASLSVALVLAVAGSAGVAFVCSRGKGSALWNRLRLGGAGAADTYSGERARLLLFSAPPTVAAAAASAGKPSRRGSYTYTDLVLGDSTL